jgi:hypothetical protein
VLALGRCWWTINKEKRKWAPQAAPATKLSTKKEE